MEEKTSLFDIDRKIFELISLDESELIDLETGEVLIDVFAELDKLQIERKDKIINIARYIDGLNRESALLKEKSNQLSERAKSKENRANRLKAYVCESMVNSGLKKIEDETVTVRVNTSKAVNVIDQSLIPDEYIKKVVKVEPDKRRILAELRNGVQIAGVELAENNSITVR